MGGHAQLDKRWNLQRMGIIKPRVIVIATDASMAMMGGYNCAKGEVSNRKRESGAEAEGRR